MDRVLRFALTGKRGPLVGIVLDGFVKDTGRRYGPDTSEEVSVPSRFASRNEDFC